MLPSGIKIPGEVLRGDVKSRFRKVNPVEVQCHYRFIDSVQRAFRCVCCGAGCGICHGIDRPNSENSKFLVLLEDIFHARPLLLQKR